MEWKKLDWELGRSFPKVSAFSSPEAAVGSQDTLQQYNDQCDPLLKIKSRNM